MAGDSQFELEINLLNMMQHPNIVSLLGVCTEGTERMAVLEFASKVRAYTIPYGLYPTTLYLIFAADYTSRRTILCT